jgi:hypothetical protein
MFPGNPSIHAFALSFFSSRKDFYKRYTTYTTRGSKGRWLARFAVVYFLPPDAPRYTTTLLWLNENSALHGIMSHTGR